MTGPAQVLLCNARWNYDVIRRAGWQLQPGIAVSRRKYGLAPSITTAYTPDNASLWARVHLDFRKCGMSVIRRMSTPAVKSHSDPKALLEGAHQH